VKYVLMPLLLLDQITSHHSIIAIVLNSIMNIFFSLCL